jgi:hypothetical protein
MPLPPGEGTRGHGQDGHLRLHRDSLIAREARKVTAQIEKTTKCFRWRDTAPTIAHPAEDMRNRAAGDCDGEDIGEVASGGFLGLLPTRSIPSREAGIQREVPDLGMSHIWQAWPSQRGH